MDNYNPDEIVILYKNFRVTIDMLNAQVEVLQHTESRKNNDTTILIPDDHSIAVSNNKGYRTIEVHYYEH